MKIREIAILATSHLTVDISQGALPALLPFLIVSRGLSLQAAGGLIFAGSVASSVVQPIFGHYADKLSRSWLMPAGLVLAGICMALVGIIPSYWGIVCTVAICGLGVAAFHPEGARLINVVSGDNKATAMSIFSIGGNAGFAVGPLLVTAFMVLCGMPGTLLLAVPCLVMAFLLSLWLRRFGELSAAAPERAVKAVAAPARDAWGPFCILSIGVFIRSIVFYALLAFLPLYWVRVLGQPPRVGDLALTLFIVCGVIGTLVGGRLGDRYGYLTIIRVGFILLIPLLFIFVRLPHVMAATAMLIPLGFLYYAPFSSMVVLGQKYLPNRVGLASGVTLGLAVSIGGASTPILGRFADQHGISAALGWVAFLPIAVMLTAFFLPAPQGATAMQPVPRETPALD